MYYKKLYFILTAYLSAITFPVFADDDITSPGFTITLSNLDPVPHGSTSVPGWRAALMTILQNLSEILLFTIPLIAGVSFIIAGYFYIFSSGDTEKANQWKTIIKWNIIAILVAFFSWTLVQLIVSFFS
jgi:hypothetical protein